MKKNTKALIVSLIISLGTGFLSGLLSMSSRDVYASVNKPSLAPPPIVFPIVWTVLFVLMGISSYLVWKSRSENKGKALTVYGIQLAFNFVWPLIFFNAQAFLFAFYWLVILYILVLAMIFLFYDIDKTAAYLQIPYILWLTFAGYLNIMVYLLNK